VRPCNQTQWPLRPLRGAHSGQCVSGRLLYFCGARGGRHEDHTGSPLLSDTRAGDHNHQTMPLTIVPSGRPLAIMEHVLSVSFPPLHHPKSKPHATGVHLSHYPHPLSIGHSRILPATAAVKAPPLFLWLQAERPNRSETLAGP
jgi:hypothetical protein